MPKLWERPWTREEDLAIRNLTHWTMRGGRDRSENPREWNHITRILNESAIVKKIQGGRWYTKETVVNRYHHYIKFNYETKTEWDARVTAIQAELAHEKSRNLNEMAAKYNEERDRSIHRAAALAQMAKDAQYEEEAAEDTAEQTEAKLKADKANKAKASKVNRAQAAREQRDAFSWKEVENEDFIRDRERAGEKAKITEAERSPEIHLEAFEERLSREGEAAVAANRVEKVEGGNPKRFNPFEGRPLDKNFPKTPMNFYKGEVQERVKQAGKAHKSKPKPFSPFEGIPLSPNFPKTPMNFYKGEVEVKAPKVSRCAPKTVKEVQESRSTKKAPEVIVVDDEPVTNPEGEGKGKGKRSNIEMILNDEPWYD